jgi:hypothetical protein
MGLPQLVCISAPVLSMRSRGWGLERPRQVIIAYFGATVLIISFGVLAFLVYPSRYPQPSLT